MSLSSQQREAIRTKILEIATIIGSSDKLLSEGFNDFAELLLEDPNQAVPTLRRIPQALKTPHDPKAKTPRNPKAKKPRNPKAKTPPFFQDANDFFDDFKYGEEKKRLTQNNVSTLTKLVERVLSEAASATDLSNFTDKYRDNPSLFWSGICVLPRNTLGARGVSDAINLCISSQDSSDVRGLSDAITGDDFDAAIRHRLLCLELWEYVNHWRCRSQDKRTVDKGMKHLTVTLNEIESEEFGDCNTSQLQQFRNHVKEGERWGAANKGVVIALGSMATSNAIRKLTKEMTSAFFSFLKTLQEYKDWEKLSPLATSIKDSCSFNTSKRKWFADPPLVGPCASQTERDVRDGMAHKRIRGTRGNEGVTQLQPPHEPQDSIHRSVGLGNSAPEDYRRENPGRPQLLPTDSDWSRFNDPERAAGLPQPPFSQLPSDLDWSEFNLPNGAARLSQSPPGNAELSQLPSDLDWSEFNLPDGAARLSQSLPGNAELSQLPNDLDWSEFNLPDSAARLPQSPPGNAELSQLPSDLDWTEFNDPVRQPLELQGPSAGVDWRTHSMPSFKPPAWVSC